MNLQEMIRRALEARAVNLTQRQVHTDAILKLRSEVESTSRDLTAAEAETLRSESAARTALDAVIATQSARIDQLEAELRDDEAMQVLQAIVVPTGVTRNGQAIVGSEPHTYSAQTEREGRSFFGDAYRARINGDTDALQRLARNNHEMRVDQEHSGQVNRAVATSSAGSLVIPQYLPGLVALGIRAGRPTANAIGSMPLPAEGMTITIPRLTTLTTTAVQATQNSSASSTDAAITDLVINIVTVAGQQDISRQLLERGAGVDQIIFADLAADYATNVNKQVLTGTGTGGQALGIIPTSGVFAATAFGAAPTVGNFYSKLAGLIAAITGQGAGIYPKIIVMHPRRWGWLTAQVDSTGRPVVVPLANGPYNATAMNLQPGMYGGDSDPIHGLTIVGSIHGIPVTTDASLPTTVGTNSEDQLVVLDTQKLLLWEDGDGAPTELRFDQTLGNQLTTKLVAFGYIGFSAGRYPGASGKAGGLDTTATFGLVAPTF